MKHVLEVCLIAATLSTTASVAQSESTPALRQGISVQMAKVDSAVPMPAADNENAWIVTVTADGQNYFGVDRLTPAGLEQRMIRTPRQRDQKLYIKADVRVPFAIVRETLDAASAAEFQAPVLLVNQGGPVTQGTIVSPKGLEISIDRTAHSGEHSILELQRSAQGPLALRMDEQEVALADLHRRLDQLARTGKEKTILLRADGRYQFGEVALVIDACSTAGLKVVVATR